MTCSLVRATWPPANTTSRWDVLISLWRLMPLPPSSPATRSLASLASQFSVTSAPAAASISDYASGRRSEFRIGYEIFDGKLRPLVGAAGSSHRPRKHRTIPRALYLGWPGQPVRAKQGNACSGDGFARFAEPRCFPSHRSVGSGDFELHSTRSRKRRFSLIFPVGAPSTAQQAHFRFSNSEVPSGSEPTCPDEFLGNHYVYSSFGFRRELYRLPQLVGKRIYWGGWYEAVRHSAQQSTIPAR